MQFRSHVKTPPEAVAHAKTHVFQEMIAADEINTPRDIAGRYKIEAVAGHADTGEQIDAHFTRYRHLMHRIHIGEKRAVSFVPVIVALVVAPRTLNINSEVIFGRQFRSKNIGRNAGVKSVFFLQGLKRGHIRQLRQCLKFVAANH